MPRIYSSQSDPLDFCRGHFPDYDLAFYLYSNLGDGPDGRGNCFVYDTEHPSYYPEDYFCETCDTPLTEEDD